MLDRAAIQALVPQKDAMCLLDGVHAWSPSEIVAFSRSHLCPRNPLRHDGRLSAISGCEYGFQAAALHGALSGGRPQSAGRVARVQLDRIVVDRLDVPAFGTLAITARLEHADSAWLAYSFRLTDQDGAPLVEGRGIIVLS